MTEALSNEQFSEHVKKHGGGSIGFFTREPVSGRGFMTAISGSETPEREITPEKISEFAEKHKEKAASLENPMHGVWGTTQDVSVKAETPNKAKAIGVPTGEEAAYGLPHTPVNRKGATMGPHGGDVLFHTGDLGKNDVDPNYRPGALDMKGGKGSFTKNQYKNKDWNKVAGKRRNPETGKMENVKYEEILRTINKNRAMKIREGNK